MLEFDPSTKIKLQLFPIDEVTRAGLEMVGLLLFSNGYRVEKVKKNLYL